MNAYTFEIAWNNGRTGLESRDGVAFIHAQAETQTHAECMVAHRMALQGFNVVDWGHVTYHGILTEQSLIDYKHQPCKNGIL